MYLLVILQFFCVLITLYSLEGCGCHLNRNSECSSTELFDYNKYSKEANEAPLDNNEKEYKDDISGMVLIKSGTFEMGTSKPVFESDYEGPTRNISVLSFYLDKYEVSNQDFKNFIRATGYETEAEIFGDSFIFDAFLPDELKEEYKDFRAVQAPWWVKMKGVYWKHPEGPNSSIADKLNHPVVHVSWNDAVKYCEHVGKRLPTEAEWEMGCRGGLRQKLYPWGNKLNPKGEHWANIWQGEFPQKNTAEDGFESTSPVDHYPPNKFGLHNMAGNVWEWTQDSWLKSSDMKVKKGGSYMCHESYCWRYRCAARSQNTRDSSAGNLGFRCAKDGAGSIL